MLNQSVTLSEYKKQTTGNSTNTSLRFENFKTNKKMKGYSKSIGGFLSREERKRLMKLTSIAKSIKTLMLITVSTSGTIILKGKLGFSRSTADTVFYTKAKAIYDALLLDAGGYYTPAFDRMVLLNDQIIAFAAAMANVGLKIMGSVGAKKAAKTLLFGTLKDALNFVNTLAYNNQLFSEEIITGANLIVAGSASSRKPDFSVMAGGSTLEVILTSRAVKDGIKYVKASYDWQYSKDGGITWVDLDSTQTSKTLAVDMPLGDVAFRKRTNSKAGITAWCRAIVFNVK